MPEYILFACMVKRNILHNLYNIYFFYKYYLKNIFEHKIYARYLDGNILQYITMRSTNVLYSNKGRFFCKMKVRLS